METVLNSFYMVLIRKLRVTALFMFVIFISLKQALVDRSNTELHAAAQVSTWNLYCWFPEPPCTGNQPFRMKLKLATAHEGSSDVVHRCMPCNARWAEAENRCSIHFVSFTRSLFFYVVCRYWTEKEPGECKARAMTMKMRQWFRQEVLFV